MLKDIKYIALFINCFVIGRIVSTDGTNCNLLDTCKYAFAALILDTIILALS